MAKALDQPSLYDTDYVAWLAEQVAHLRAGRLGALDVENVALELLLHLLKWYHQPDQRSNRWRASVAEQRRRIRDLVNDSPSLKQEVLPLCRAVYPDAVQGAAIETQLGEEAFPSTLPYTVEQIFERVLPAEELPDQRPVRKKPR